MVRENNDREPEKDIKPLLEVRWVQTSNHSSSCSVKLPRIFGEMTREKNLTITWL